MNKEITVIVNKLSSEVDNFNYAIFEDKHEQLIKEVVEVSEEFAILFADWILNNMFEMRTDNHQDWWGKLNEEKDYTSKDLLNLFKNKYYDTNK